MSAGPLLLLCGVTGRLPRDRCNAIELYIVSRVGAAGWIGSSDIELRL